MPCLRNSVIHFHEQDCPVSVFVSVHFSLRVVYQLTRVESSRDILPSPSQGPEEGSG
jgi:hypothetical protein